MFEIPSNDQKLYMLKDCRKMDADSIDCKCTYLGKECQQSHLQKCSNCSCLKASTRIFYIKKRYGAVCFSLNNLNNAAGFGERFKIQTPEFKQCAIADKTIHTIDCAFNDLRQVWLWTPGNLLMNAKTSTCLQTLNTKDDYIPMTLKQCDSSDLRQKWRCTCDEWFLWGVSFTSPTITHAVRYYNRARNLLVRNVKIKVSKGNVWTVFPTANQSVCSASHTEGSFYFSDENTNISQIDLVPPCFNGKCSKKLLTSMSAVNISNCTILWEEKFIPNSEPFAVEDRSDVIYFMWMSNPYTRLSGKTLDLTIECLRNRKFEEYLFRLRVKSIILKAAPEQSEITKTSNTEDSTIPIVYLRKNCIKTLCSRKITVSSTFKRSMPICYISWEKSTVSRLHNTTVPIQNFTELLSLGKVQETFRLEWNLTDAPLLANVTFNLTILCFNDDNENTTTVDTSSLVFQTKYDVSTPDKSSATKTSPYLAIILPVVIVLVLIITLVLWGFCRRKQSKRIKESTSKSNLNKSLELQYSNGSIELGLNLNNGVDHGSEDNPVYEHCIQASHPTVTIARNKLYESTKEASPGRDSDIYEKPLQSTNVINNKFYESVDPSKNVPKLSPNLALKPCPNPQPAKRPPTPPCYKTSRLLHPPEDEQDVYDQPSGFIPSLQRKQDDQKTKDELPLQELQSPRVHSTYDKPLPDSPPISGIYDYATREDLSIGTTHCEAEKPFEFTKTREHGGSVNSNGSVTYDTPQYDVLESN